MNIQAAATEPSPADAPAGQALALPPNLAEMCDGRDRAIALWLESYDTLHANVEAAARASIGGKIALTPPSSERYDNGDAKITRKFLAVGPTRHYDQETRRETHSTARDDFEAAITQEVDRRCWGHLMEKLGFDALLDRQAREEFNASLRTEPPAFTAENCTASFGNIWVNRRDMYLRGIASAFMRMDRRFRSHDAFAIGTRLIIERAMNADSWGGWNSYERRDTLHDVERIFRELDGKGPISPNMATGIVHEVEATKRSGGLPKVVQGDYFRVRVFQNGNLHLWFERKDLLAEVNKLLLEYYKPVEGDAGEGPSYESTPLYHATPAKNYGAFFTSEAVAALVMERAGITKGDRVLEPSAGSGVLAKAARAAGGNVTCIEIQPGLAHELTAVHNFNHVHERDFLQTGPARLGLFDRIVMNPPFDRGRDCDHVRHAFHFLKPGGTLVAIMSARAEFGTDARHKALHDLIVSTRERYYGRKWIDLPERSFAHAGTNVNTVMLVLRKPR
jgi:protein-L-isoaspartate O-methyltransferase